MYKIQAELPGLTNQIKIVKKYNSVISIGLNRRDLGAQLPKISIIPDILLLFILIEYYHSL